jgi:uncharacterized protein YvpB
MIRRILLVLLGIVTLVIGWIIFLPFFTAEAPAQASVELYPSSTPNPTRTAGKPLAIKHAPGVSPTRTPFQPATYTPIPSYTPTNTATASPTATSSATATPSVTPTATLPAAASVDKISGLNAAYTLDCESRSAVDWAGYFGVQIDEINFFNALPHSDNPDRGFVGNVHGAWGQIPPNDYGVHAKPVAKLLRTYGVEAQSIYGMSWDELRAEIAAGRPVIVWVIGRVARGTPVPYTAPDGHETIVARFEHTVIVTGYSEDNVEILDGGLIYDRSVKYFLESWGVLGNMAVVWDG